MPWKMKPTEVFLGIVLRAERVKDADVRVSLLTAEGVRTATAVGAARANPQPGRRRCSVIKAI